MRHRNDIEVALRSSRTRTTVPSRISRTIGSAASERAPRSDAPTPDDFEVDHPGDYATFNSYQPSDGTSGHSVLASTLLPRCTVHGSRPKN